MSKKRISYKKLAVLHNALMDYDNEVTALAEESEDGTGIGSVRGYHCMMCGIMISTVVHAVGDIDMQIPCIRKGCKSVMVRNDKVYQYKSDIAVTHHWIRPSLEYLKKNRDKIKMIDDVFAGKLILLKLKKHEH